MQQQMPNPQQQNGHLSPYGVSHGPSPQMRNGPMMHGQPQGIPGQDPQMQMNMYGMPPTSMHPPNSYYGQPPMQAPYMNGSHPMQQQPPPR